VLFEFDVLATATGPVVVLELLAKLLVVVLVLAAEVSVVLEAPPVVPMPAVVSLPDDPPGGSTASEHAATSSSRHAAADSSERQAEVGCMSKLLGKAGTPRDCHPVTLIFFKGVGTVMKRCGIRLHQFPTRLGVIISGSLSDCRGPAPHPP
jgi:hypothetical protein